MRKSLVASATQLSSKLQQTRSEKFEHENTKTELITNATTKYRSKKIIIQIALKTKPGANMKTSER